MIDLYTYFDKNLNRITTTSYMPVSSDIQPDQIISGSVVASLGQTIGDIQTGKTTFDNVDTGYILGLDKGTPKFYIGTPTHYLNFTGTDVVIAGSITVDSGTIGGFTIGSDYLRDLANSFGLASTVTGGDDVRFWAGDTYANRATADFRVTEAGIVNASKITISGGADVSFISDTLDTSSQKILKDFTFDSTDYSGAFKSGDITWNADTGVITGGSGIVMYKGGLVGATAGATTFSLDATTGNLILAGYVRATAGFIGGTLGWAIGDGYLYTSSAVSGLNTGWCNPTATGGKFTGAWSNPTNAYSSNDSYATMTGRMLSSTVSNANAQSYETFGFSIPAGSTITGIEVSVEGYKALEGGNNTNHIYVDIYNNSGAGWATESDEVAWTTSDTTLTKGSAIDLWGKTWIVSDFTDGNFSVYIRYWSPNNPSYGTTYLDHIKVKVYYQYNTTSGLAPADYPFWAGSTYADRATAAFRVATDGDVNIASATITNASITTLDIFPVTPSSAPDANYEVANKKYVDDQISGLPDPPEMYSADSNFLMTNTMAVAQYDNSPLTISIQENVDNRVMEPIAIHTNKTSREINPTPTSWTKIKESTMLIGGTFTITWQFDISGCVGSIVMQSKVYRNGVAVGTLKSHTAIGGSYLEFDTVSGWTAGDLLQIYVNGSDADGKMQVSCLYIFANFGETTADY